MKKAEINLWIRYFFPIVLSLVLGLLVFLIAQFREPPKFAAYSLIWFGASTFLIWEAGWRISSSLDPKYPWKKGVFKRLALQLCSLSLVGISFFVFMFVLLNLYENIILEKLNPLGYLHIIISAAIGMILVLIISSVQVGYLLLQNWQQIELEAISLQKKQAMDKLDFVSKMVDAPLVKEMIGELPTSLLDDPVEANKLLTQFSKTYQQRQEDLTQQLSAVREALSIDPIEKNNGTALTQNTSQKKFKNRFLVKKGSRYFLIPLADIVVFQKDDLVILHTKAGKKFAVDYSLEELTNLLNPDYFFRINRQCIVHTIYLEEMKMEGAQMIINLSVAFPNPLAVSQRNIPTFKRWLEAPWSV